MKVHDKTGAAPPRTAVALSYDGKAAPRVTAKGHGAVAQEILARAEQHGIPLYQDAELAAALSRVGLGEEIPHTLYRACAVVIAFAWRLNQRSAA